ncbi:MAG: hypothetical protein L3J93_03800 [Thermoplasmata archaeon]|nr:hypothetical protein [Thermoplasmata archaeon]
MVADEFVFAHLADAHVGAWPRDAAVRTALRESVLQALAVVDDRDCAFLLISGDLFHTPVPDPAEVAPVAAALRLLVDHGRRIYVIYGSHDYVAHRTSWLDVLAETGLFLRAAPEAVHTEGDRWTLPYLTDPGTGARIAGISGRSQGLDRGAFLAVDSEAFRAEPGFKIFQFHAAIREYLPPALRQHIEGISKEDLPGGCDYYAGGHIHQSYEGTGPGGLGLLVNPGAVFGTSVTDIESGVRGRSARGLAIVTVRGGVPSVEFVGTALHDVQVFDIDLGGASVREARARVAHEIEVRRAPGALLFPRIRGVLTDGSLGALGLHRSLEGTDATAAPVVHWDLSGLETADTTKSELLGPPESLELTMIRGLAEEEKSRLSDFENPEAMLLDLLHELGQPPAEGEARADYEGQRSEGARRILRVPPQMAR